MKSPRLSVVAFAGLVAALTVGCATAPPSELVRARTAYARASAGRAAKLAPADLHRSRLALDQAERALSAERDPAKAVDFAYIAERTAQIAEAHAQTALIEKATSKATQDLGDKQSELAKQVTAQLAEARRGEAQQIGVERTARQAAEKKADASEQKADASEERAAVSDQRAQRASEALERVEAKADARGFVITLSGNVLFHSNGTELLPAALRRLDEVASVLVAQGESAVVEGYTDSKGSPSSNVDLSRRRAEAVRRYLVSRGCPTDHVVARGMGPERPVADNTSGEGRASNRRVEIVINRPDRRTP